MTAKTYSTAESFKTALEQRLRGTSSGTELTRNRQLLVFDRFLARLTATLGDAIVLKGGLALELRLDRARTTNDVDLRMTGTPRDTLARLQAAGRVDLRDFLSFEVSEDREHPEIQNDSLKYDGFRFKATCMLGAKLYGQPFGVDVVFGEPILGEPEVVQAEDVLAFAGIQPPSVRIYPAETHLAEKVHAYTMPRRHLNSRVKDLPDIALLATAKAFDSARLRQALEETFAFLDTHGVPQSLPAPAPEWAEPYAEMAEADGLPWRTIEEVTVAAQSFLDPVLARELAAQWDPRARRWRGLSPERI